MCNFASEWEWESMDDSFEDPNDAFAPAPPFHGDPDPHDLPDDPPFHDDSSPPLLRIDGVPVSPPILASRGARGMSVEARLSAIIGDSVRQIELISLRQGLFNEVMPPLTRPEKRTKGANLATFESCRDALLPILDTPAGIARVVEVALANRTNDRERLALKLHIFNLN
jgi:hypothetical protein